MDKEQKAIERLKEAADMSLSCYGKPLIITYSGGKDSEVLLELAIRSGINFEVNHSYTTADAPQTVYHIRKVFKDLEEQGIKCGINYPEMSISTRKKSGGRSPILSQGKITEQAAYNTQMFSAYEADSLLLFRIKRK